MQKIKYRIMLFRKEFESLRVVKTKTFKHIADIMKIESRNYIINITQPTYLLNNYVYFCVDIDTNAQMFFKSEQICLNSNEVDSIVENKLIQEITKGAMDSLKDKITNIIIGAIFGALIAALIAVTYYNQQINDIYANMVQTTLIA